MPPHLDHKSHYQQNTPAKMANLRLDITAVFCLLLRLKIYTGARDNARFYHFQISTTPKIYLLKMFEVTAVFCSVTPCSVDDMTQE